MYKRFLMTLAAACLVLFGSSAALADSIPVITFNQATGGSGLNQAQSVGWQFNVLNPLTVNALGWFDEGADGLGHSHTVGIWNPAGALLTSILVPAGTVASLNGVYRMVSIADLILPVANGYIIGGENFDTSGDRLAADVTQTVDSRLGFVDATFSSPLGSGFTRPTLSSVATDGFYGPMFAAASASVPEPASILLLVSVVLLTARRFASRGKSDPGRQL
jgi:hypothetical protein